MVLFDTHAHYDDSRFDGDRDSLLSSLPGSGIGHVVNVGCDLPSSRKSVALAEKYPFVYAAVGVHPHQADDMVPDYDLPELENLLRHPKVVALGEIGLDYHYDFSPRMVQIERFAQQMELASLLSVPVIIHMREATADCLDVVKNHKIERGVFHCYTGSIETARELLPLGYYFSFTGAITFKNARRIAEVVKYIPEDRIMIETDCPYMTPEPFRGRRCDSTLMKYTLNALAEIRGITPEEAAELTFNNAMEFFGLRSRG